MPKKMSCLDAILPTTLCEALWEHCELKRRDVNREVARAIRAYLIDEWGDRYGTIFENLDKLEGMDRRKDG